MEEKKTKSERNKDESQQNKKWIESLGFENLPVEEWRTHGERMKNARGTDEERWRTTENLHKITHGNVSEALRKHLGLDFLHGNYFFHPQQLKYIARGLRDP